MKRQLLLTFACSSLLLCGAKQLNAQYTTLVTPTFLVNSPTAVSGVKTITMSNDGDPQTAGNWGRAIDSFWYNLPIDTASSDTLGCSTLTPGSLTGKFALVSRGTCNFSEKAYNAQLAGAVAIIIYNNVAGGPVGMAAGTNAGLVTIPVVMISQDDGLAIKAQIASGQTVRGSLTNWGFGFTHDLGIVNNSMALFHSRAIPKYELTSGTPDAYKVYTGAFVGNFGISSETNVKLKSTLSFTPTSGTPAVLAQDSVVSPTTFTTLDSVIEVVSPNAMSIPSITQTGTLSLTYNVSAANADDQADNNTGVVTAEVTDSTYSKGRLDANGKPVVSIGYRFSDNTANTWGPLYYVREGGHQAVKVAFTVSDGGTGTSLDGNSMNLFVYKWNDANGDHLVNATELNMEGLGLKVFSTADTGFQIFEAALTDLNGTGPLILSGNSWYWIAAEVPGTLYLGCVDQENYFMRSFASLHATPSVPEFWAPQFHGSTLDLGGSTDMLSHFPFLANTVVSADTAEGNFSGFSDKTPAIALYTSKAIVNSVPAVSSENNGVSVYPSPATNAINIDYRFSKEVKDVTITIIDAVGRTVYKNVKSINGKSGVINLSTANLSSGNYFLVMRGNGQALVNKFTIAR